MTRYVQTMVRNEPVLALIFVIMALVLAFGVWEWFHVVKR
jgi:hypothetical protein